MGTRLFVVHTLAAGLRRAIAAPKLVALLWLANTMAALPFAIATTNALANDIGASRVEHTLRQGFDTEWLAEYDVRAQGVATLFTPLRTGAGAVYDNLDAWLSGDLFRDHPALLALGVVYGLLWILLQGGILARLTAPEQRFTFGRFMGAGGRYFGRLTQIAGIAFLVYYALYRLTARVFDKIDLAFRDHGTEGELLARSLIVGTLFVLMLHLVRMLSDYAKIATVVQDTRWSPIALWQGIRFVMARPGRTIGVYLGMGLISLAFLALYARLAPGPTDSTPVAVVLGFVISQVFVAGRLLLRVATLDAELSTFRATGGL